MATLLEMAALAATPDGPRQHQAVAVPLALRLPGAMARLVIAPNAAKAAAVVQAMRQARATQAATGVSPVEVAVVEVAAHPRAAQAAMVQRAE